MEQISEAEGFSVTLNASAKGSTTVTDAEGVATPTTIDESVSDTFRMDEGIYYISNTLSVLDDIWGLLGGIDGLGAFFAETAAPLPDNSGYEYTVTVETEDLLPALQAVQGFFAQGEEDADGEPTPSVAEGISLHDVFGMILPQTAPEGAELSDGATADDIEKAWVAEIFSADFTVGDLYGLLNAVLEEKEVSAVADTLVQVVTAIALGTRLDLKTLGALLDTTKVIVGEDGSISFAEEGTPLGSLSLAALANPMLGQALPGLTYESIGMLLPLLWDSMNVAQIYDMVADMSEKPLPKSGDMESVQLETAELTVTVKTDKNGKPLSFSASAAFKGGYSVTDSYEDTVTSYAADITATASGTFGYEKAAA